MRPGRTLAHRYSGFALLLWLILLPACARAEDAAERLLAGLDLSALQAQADEVDSGFSIRETALSLLKGETDLADLLTESLAGLALVREAPAIFVSFLAPSLIWCLCGAILGEKGRGLAGRFCACALAGAFLSLFYRVFVLARGAAGWISRLCTSAAPVLTTLLSASGGPASAVLITPAASMAAQMCAGIICGASIPAIGAAGLIALCPAFSRRFGFQGVRKLITGLCGWLHGGMLGLFTSLLSMRGLLKTGADSLSLQTARYTVDSLLPVIGGDVADSLGLLMASARAVQSGVGVCCCSLLALVCAEPIAACVVSLMIVRICRVLAETMGAGEAGALLGGFSEVFTSLLIAVSGAALLFIVLLGACVTMAGSFL